MSRILFLLVFICLADSVIAQTPELVLPVGHHEITGVYDVDISRDGKLAASLADEELKIWDFQSGALLKTWRHPNKIRYSRCQFTPDGKFILMAGSNSYGGGSRLSVISTNTLTLDRDITNPSGSIGSWHVLVSPDSRWAYTGSFNSGVIQKINLETNEVRTFFELPKGEQVESLSLSDDGQSLLAMIGMGKYGGSPFQSVLLSTSTGAHLQTLPPNEQYQKITPTGKLFKVERVDTNKETEKIYRFTWIDPKTLRAVAKQELVKEGYSLSYPEALIFSYQFFPGSDRVLYTIQNEAFSASPQEVVTAFNFNGKAPRYKHLQISADGRQLLVGTGDSELLQYDLTQKKLFRQLGMDVFSPTDAYAATKGQTFVVAGDSQASPWLFAWNGGHLRAVRLRTAESGVMRFVNESVVNVSPDGSLVAWGTANGTVQVADVKKPSISKKSFPINAYHLVISADNKYVIVSTKGDQLYLCDLATGASRMIGTGKFKWGVTDESGRYFFGLDNTKDNESYSVYVDLQSGIKLWEKLDKENFLGRYPFFLNAQEVGYTNSYQRFLVLINRQTGALRKQDFSVELLNSNPAIKQEIAALELTQVEGTSARRGAAVGQNGFYSVFGKYGDNAVKIYRNTDRQKLAEIILSAKTDDWAVVTPDGRFDASDGMLKQLYYTKGREIIPLEALSEKYYTPNLLAIVLSEQPSPTPIPTPKKDDIKNLKSPPLTKILPPVDIDARNLFVAEDSPALRRYDSKTGRIKLTVEASSNDDGISEIRLFHNGKAVGGDTRNLTVEDDRLDRKKTQTFELQLSDGNNSFRAIALNGQRTESRPDEIIVVNKQVNPTVSEVPGSTLHLLIIGINQYKNSKYNLNYATADAVAFKAAIESKSTGIFARVNPMYIGDAQATKAGIMTELEKIKAVAQPRDVFIFYYAGHGVMSEKKEFFLVPHDVTQLYGADEALAQKGISSALMQQYSKEIKAQKQLFILDACQSAGALDQVAMRGAAEEKAISQLARATGTHWLTASGSEQFAAEFKQLGHGTFTYVLLEALNGKADKGNDRKITVKELDAYLQEVVPEITAKYKGTPQYPASYGFGNDFPIGVIK